MSTAVNAERIDTAPRPDPASAWARAADFVARTLGLQFGVHRLPELQRGVRRASQDLGFTDELAFLRTLDTDAPSASAVQALAEHLTIGETYFFRDAAMLAALEHEVLAPLVAKRRGVDPRLSLWCAACCTGEEAYTLAMIVSRLLPDIADWDVRIVATDINTRFLAKAEAATYGPWSFRNAPQGLAARYFEPASGGQRTVLPAIRRLVRFAPLNLAGEHLAVPGVDLAHFDAVLCRNVLMYFSPRQMERVLARLHERLSPRGWLLLGPGEGPASRAGQALFEPVFFDGAVLLRKREDDAASAREPEALQALAAGTTLAPVADEPPHAPCAELLTNLPNGDAQTRVQVDAQAETEARALADAGRHDEALACCERWISAQPMTPAALLLASEIRLERATPGDTQTARDLLRRALYLEPACTLAHAALGRLALAEGDRAAAGRHLRRAQQSLADRPADALVEGGGGLTVTQVGAQIAMAVRALQARDAVAAAQRSAGGGTR